MKGPSFPIPCTDKSPSESADTPYASDARVYSEKFDRRDDSDTARYESECKSEAQRATGRKRKVGHERKPDCPLWPWLCGAVRCDVMCACEMFVLLSRII